MAVYRRRSQSEDDNPPSPIMMEDPHSVPASVNRPSSAAEACEVRKVLAIRVFDSPPHSDHLPGQIRTLQPLLTRKLHTTKDPAFCQLQLQANYIHQLIHGRIVDSPDALAEVYNCLHYFSRLNSTLQLLCDKVLEMHVTALLDAAPKFLRNRLTDVLQGTLIEVEPGVLLMFHDPDKAASHAQLGTIRVITFNTARFIVQTFPLMASARSGKDAQNLQAPHEFINLMMLRSTEFTTFYREMIDVFSAYWKHRSQIMQRISPKNEGIERIKKYLLKIVNDLLVKLADVPFG
ncbi:hypothetical protein pipiens_017964 [Culex pipiens pipiens]|uniref:Uncharacterized protein n=1 Tax=Culex pipiens pipiens TaxID=38569 RepID=A0ABD1CE73_CULPP